MPVGSFSKYLSGFTSDHTYQSATVESETSDHKEIALTGMTWDLMNKGYSAAIGNGKSNNPFDLDETDQAYELRKKKQLKFLSRSIRKSGLDFVFLQEVDIFTHAPLPDMVKDFLEMLKRIGWKVVHSEKADNLIIPLLTLYNGNKLIFVAKRALFPAKNGKNTGLEAEFKDIATSAAICLTNVYLDRGTDHNVDLDQYQDAQIEKEKLTIIGGDTNPARGVEYHGLVGDKNKATSIEALQAVEYENAKT